METLLVIEWQDTCSNDEWQSGEDARNLKPVRVTSTGFLIFEDTNQIILSSMVIDKEHMSMVQCIPVGCIVSKKLIEQVEDTRG